MQSMFTKDNGPLMGHIGRTPQAVRTYMLNKARKIRRSRSASQVSTIQSPLVAPPRPGVLLLGLLIYALSDRCVKQR